MTRKQMCVVFVSTQTGVNSLISERIVLQNNFSF